MRTALPGDRWEQVEKLFQDAADLPAGKREEFLSSRCGTDSQLREEVLSLLRYDTTGGPPLLDAIHADAASLVGDETVAGTMVGPYRIEKEIGRGGMSMVYLAVRADGEFQKRVAIKLIKRGMDTVAVIKRLRQERRILAALEHPSIARLLDGGTTLDGRPWIAMEYVEGVPIGRFCAQHDLPVEERCRLITRVCDAVAYAHRNLVVHRDLKPANILVTPDGNPKLLDFGIAKLLSYEVGEEGPETRGPFKLLTPEYASPEQLNGGVVGTTADVYSLGVVLYELLAGERPRPAGDQMEKSSVAASRMGRERRWSRRLAGDLDNILQMALRPEPERRYLSIGEFEADLHLHLKGLPVTACQETLLYRAGKFLMRHRLGAIGTLLIVLSLASGMASTVWQARRTEEARQIAESRRIEAERDAEAAAAAQRRAEGEHAEAERQRASADRRFAQVRELAGKFLFDFNDAIATLPGSTPARKKVVETGVRYYDSLVKEAGDNRELLEEIACGYDRLGDVEGNPYHSNLGDLAGAAASYRKALGIRERISDPSPEFLRDRILGHVRIAQILQVQGRFEDSARYVKQALDFAPHPKSRPASVRDALATAWSVLGDDQMRGGDNAAALRSREELLALRVELAKESGPSDINAQRGLSGAESKLGEYYFRIEIPEPAISHLLAAREIDQRLSAADPGNVGLMRKLRITEMLLGSVLSGSGKRLAKPGQATAILEEAVRLTDRMLDADPDNRQALEDSAITGTSLGDSLHSDKNIAGARAAWEKAMASAQRLPAANTNDGILSQLYRRRAISLSDAGKLEEALQNLRLAEEHATATEKNSPNTTMKLVRLADIVETRADLYIAADRFRDAAAEIKSNIAIYDELARLDPGNPLFLDGQPPTYVKLADCYRKSGERDNERRAIETALDLYAAVEARHPLTADQKQIRADARTRLDALLRE